MSNKLPHLYADGSELTIGFLDGNDTGLVLDAEGPITRADGEALLEQWTGAVTKLLGQVPTPEVQRLLRVLLSKVWPQIVVQGTINYFGLDEPDTSDPDTSSIRRLMDGYEALWRLAGHDGPPDVRGVTPELGIRLAELPAPTPALPDPDVDEDHPYT